MKLHTETEWCLPNNVTDITCMDNQPTVVIEKVSKTVRLLGFMLQNGVSKSNRVMQDMQEMMKRGKNIGKTLNNVMVKHHEALTCRPRDADMYFISPLEYQFSCSSSPPRLSRGGASSSRRKLLSPAKEEGRRQMKVCRGSSNERRRVKMTTLSRETEKEKEFHVDQAAEEFIDKFYRELRLQKWLDHHHHHHQHRY
jgi:hypothetical protein